MNDQRWLCLFLAGVAWFLDPGVRSHAQPHSREVPRRPYVQIPFEGNLDRTLADQLLRVRGVQELKALIDQVKNNPAGFKGIAQGLPNLDLDDPAIRKTLGKLLEQQPDLFKVSPEKAKAIQDILKAGEASNLDPGRPADKAPPRSLTPDPSAPSATGQPPAGEPSPRPAHPARDPDLLTQWTRDLLAEAEDWDWDDLIKDSPALQDGLRDLQDLVVNQQGGGRRFDNAALERWTESLRLNGKWSLSLPEVPLTRLPELSLPSLPRPNLYLPGPGSWGDGRAFGLGLPSLGGAASGRAALWLAIVVLAGLVLWQITRQGRSKGIRPGRANRHPGPWPVDPAQVATRADVIRAFEYLSLLRLGPDVRTWNHRRIAAHLGADACPSLERRLAADELAVLYERARYTPAVDPLPAEDLASARRALCLLAGVASA